MNFADIYKKIKAIDEGGVALPPEDDPDVLVSELLSERMPLPGPGESDADYQIRLKQAQDSRKAISQQLSAQAAAQSQVPAVPAEPAAPTTPVISLTDGNNGTMNLPDGSSVPVTLYPEGGMQPRMPPGSEKVIADLNGQQVTAWVYNGSAYVRNYVAATMNENRNENFMSLYKQIRAIDEGTTPAPTAPGGVIKTKNADGSVSYKPKVPGERLSGTIPGTDSGAKVSDPDPDPTAPGGVIKTKNSDGSVSYKPKVPGERLSKTIPGSGAKVSTSAEEKQPTNEACGDMMSLPMGLGQEHLAQQDSVTMNVSMNGSGDGGIRDLMNILKGIENVGEPHADHDAVDIVFGGEMEPEMEAFANSMAGASGQQTFPQSAVTDIGSNSGRGDHETRKANGGGNPYTQVSEELVSQLSSLYTEIKTRQVDEGAASRIVDKVISNMSKHGAVEALHPMIVADVKRLATLEPVSRYSAYSNIRSYFKDNPELNKMASELQGGYYEADILRGKYKTDALKAKYAELEPMHQEFIKKILGQQNESYNPNSVAAEHRRGLEKSQEDSLKKKAADGDESAKKRLQALKDKKKRMANDYNDRMER